MDVSKFEFDRLPPLLRRRADDPMVVELIERAPASIERSAYVGFVVFKAQGVSVMFKEAPWVVPAPDIRTDVLHLSAFHFHAAGHEGYAAYPGIFPGGVVLGDSQDEIIRKLGEPVVRGGGGMGAVLKKPIQRWLRYSIGDAVLQFQLRDDYRTDLATLFAPDVEQLKKSS